MWRGEYLLWWIKGDQLPPMVTTSPSTVDRANAGVLGQSTTSVLFGGTTVNSSHSGARVVAGWWISPDARIEGEWFGLGQISSGFSESSNGIPVLARPFFNLSSGAQDANVIAFPNQLQGNVNISETSSFFGAGVHATQNMKCINFGCDRTFRVDFLYGYRFLQLSESLQASDSLTSIDPNGPVPVGTSFASHDSFTTLNNFNGFDLGAVTDTRWGRWCLTALGRMAIGGTSERITINGSSTSTVPGGTPTNTPGGLLAMPTNIGTFHHNGFTVVPELQLKLAYDFTQNIRFTIGYDVMYWSRVARPGSQIDTFVNPTQSSGGTLAGTPGPLFLLRETDLWVQGVSFGGEVRF